MSFGLTFTFTVNSVAKVLKRINQDNYGSEYLLRDSVEEYRMLIRHQLEAPRAGAERFDRHNVELTHTVFATSTDPVIIRQLYIVVRNRAADSGTDTGYLFDAFINALDNATLQGDLLTWQN